MVTPEEAKKAREEIDSLDKELDTEKTVEKPKGFLASAAAKARAYGARKMEEHQKSREQERIIQAKAKTAYYQGRQTALIKQSRRQGRQSVTGKPQRKRELAQNTARGFGQMFYPNFDPFAPPLLATPRPKKKKKSTSKTKTKSKTKRRKRK